MKDYTKTSISLSTYIPLILILLVGGVLAVALILSAIGTFQIPEEKDKACENLGMERTIFQGTSYCLDNDDEAHHTVFTCTGIFNIKCTAKIISLGEYRTTPTR